MVYIYICMSMIVCEPIQKICMLKCVGLNCSESCHPMVGSACKLNLKLNNFVMSAQSAINASY